MKSILIADSGSTKTHWVLQNANGVCEDYYSEGINPFFMSAEQIQILVQNTIPAHSRGDLSNVYFYGAGCSDTEKCSLVKTALQQVFSASEVGVESDLLASARALFGKSSGVACILGTGSNAAVYDGSKFVDKISSLGYLLGDEGSGAYIGKQLLVDFLRGEMPEEIAAHFESAYKISIPEVLNRVYKQKFPNRYLASYALFVGDFRGDKYIEQLLESAVEDFVRYQLNTLVFDKVNVEVGFVGSAAFYLKDLLTKILTKHGYKCGLVLQAPILKLLKYHTHESPVTLEHSSAGAEL